MFINNHSYCRNRRVCATALQAWLGAPSYADLRGHSYAAVQVSPYDISRTSAAHNGDAQPRIPPEGHYHGHPCCSQRWCATLWMSCCGAEYHLLVYGSLVFDAAYVKKCTALIKELGIQHNVELRGLGKPMDVLAKGWCYIKPRCAPLAPAELSE